MQQQERPVNLNLVKFHFPVMAIISILHRITGVILFLAVPVLLYLLHKSLISRDAFLMVQQLLDHSIAKVIVIAVLAAAVYHLFAGIRHLIMDCGIGESLKAGRITAWSVLFITLIVVILLGVRLW